MAENVEGTPPEGTPPATLLGGRVVEPTAAETAAATAAAAAAAAKAPADDAGKNDPPAPDMGNEDGKGKPDGQKADSKADAKDDGAPDKYEDFTMPEGVEVDAAAMALFTPLAKDLDLSQEQAQKLVDYDNARAQAQADASWAEWNATQTEWRDATKTDKEIGGAAMNDTIGHAKSFLTQFGTPALTEALEATGMGNHPEVVRAFARAGKAMAEDSFVIGAGGPGGPKTHESILYPNQGKKE